MPFALILAFLIAFLIAIGVTPLATRIAARYGFVDKPHPRRDAVLKPRLGGVALYVAFAVAIAATYPLLPDRTPEEQRRVVGLLVGGLVVLIVGVVDDKHELPAWPQFGAQFLAAAIAVASGTLIDKITNPLSVGLADSLLYFPEALAISFTFFWLLGAMNTINFLDGLDGLAAGVVMVAALVLAVHSFILGQFTITVLPLALAGACLGFLCFNFYPSRVTMGTSGSVFLGFAIGTLAVIGGTKGATLLLVLGLPVVDTGWTILRRLAAGQSPFRGDRTHLHHRLLEAGLSERKIVLLMYGVSALLGALALVLSTGLAKLYAIAIMAALTVAAAIVLARRARHRQQA